MQQKLESGTYSLNLSGVLQTAEKMRRRIMEEQVKRNMLQASLARIEKELPQAEERKQRCLEARALVSSVAVETQKELEFRVSELASLAVSSVFPGRYEVRVLFEEKRGKTEARMVLQDREGNEIDPEDETAGSVINLLSVAFRVTMLVLSNPRNRVIILDEPFANLQKSLHPTAISFIRKISHELGIQFLIVSHEDAIIEGADRLFTVDRKKGVTVEQ